MTPVKKSIAAAARLASFNAGAQSVQPMFNAVRYALSKNVPVVISTRVPNGRVLPNYGFEGGGKTLADAGAVMADDLSPAKARILLMLALQSGVTERRDRAA